MQLSMHIVSGIKQVSRKKIKRSYPDGTAFWTQDKGTNIGAIQVAHVQPFEREALLNVHIAH